MRKLLIVAAVLAISLCAFGCSNGLTSNDVIGDWKPQNALSGNYDIPITYVFKDDGEIDMVSTLGTSDVVMRTGTWKINGDNIIVNFPEMTSAASGVSFSAPAVVDSVGSIDEEGILSIPMPDDKNIVNLKKQ